MRKFSLLMLFVVPLLAACSSSQPTQHEAALQQWNAARANVLIGLAGDQYKSGNFDKSRLTIDEAIRLVPQNAPSRVLSAKLYIEAGQLEAAERELAVAEQVDSTGAEADYLFGVVYQRWQQPQRALEFYQRACDKSPAELAYVLAKAEMLVAMGRRDEALTMLQAKVTYFEHSGVIRDEVGLLLAQEGRYPEAIEMLRRASILSPDEPAIREHLATTLFDGGQYGACVQTLTELLADPAYARRGDLFMTLGECQLQIGQAGDAVASVQRAAELLPDSAGVRLVLARAQLQLQNLRGADQALQQAMALDDHNEGAYLLLGYLRLRQSRYTEACRAFNRAYQLDPSDTVSLCMIGLSLDKMGRPDEASACYRQVLKMEPGDELAQQLLARLGAPE